MASFLLTPNFQELQCDKVAFEVSCHQTKMQIYSQCVLCSHKLTQSNVFCPFQVRLASAWQWGHLHAPLSPPRHRRTASGAPRTPRQASRPHNLLFLLLDLVEEPVQPNKLRHLPGSVSLRTRPANPTQGRLFSENKGHLLKTLLRECNLNEELGRHSLIYYHGKSSSLLRSLQKAQRSAVM